MVLIILAIDVLGWPGPTFSINIFTAAQKLMQNCNKLFVLSIHLVVNE